MAQIVLGVATAHTPLLTLPPERWDEYAIRDRGNPELVFPPGGYAMSFPEAVDTYVPEEIRHRPRSLDLYRSQFDNAQRALDRLHGALRNAAADAIVIISDDQDEWFYDDNMPSLAIYWGDSAPMIPRPRPPVGEPLAELTQLVNDGYAAREFEVPVDAALGRHLIESVLAQGFDVSHIRTPRDAYAGEVQRRYPRRNGTETDYVRRSPTRRVGLPHGFSFVVQRLLADVNVPIVPIFQNTCYPPNNVTPSRSYAFGAALATALTDWRGAERVVVIASGGLSHFVVDEVIDRALLQALENKDASALKSLPVERLRSATSECMNWIALGGVMADQPLIMETLGYEPVYRSEAGTGAGLGFALWQ